MSSTIDIDRIVQEVVRRLQKQNGQAAVVGAGTDQRRAASGDVLRLTDDVITLAQVAERLSGVRQLVVARRAIVTPAVQDELRARRVDLVREDSGLVHNRIDRQRSQHGLVVASDEPNYHWDAVTFPGWEIVRVAGGDLTTQLQQMETHMNPTGEDRTTGLFVSRRPYVVACTANRRPAFRAAVVRNAADTTEARETLDANLFVIRALPRFRLKAIVKAIQQ